MSRQHECSRRVALAALVGLAAELTAGSRLGAKESAAWSQWRGPNAKGTWTVRSFPDQLTDDTLQRAWERPIGPGYSGIAVREGLVYTMDRPKEPADRERILCFRESTGEPVWESSYDAVYGTLDYGKGPRATPTIHDGRVYTLGAVGHAHCLDARTGQVLWSKDLVADERAQLPMWGFAASPVIHGNLVFLHTALQPDGCLAAYDRISGQEVWRSGSDPAGYCTPIVVRHGSEDLLVAWTPEHVVGVQPETGKELWKVPYKVTYGVSIATPIFEEGIVLVAGYWEGSKAIKLGATIAEQTLLWEENRFLRGLMSQPLYREGHVYLLDKQHGVVCFELASGKIRWTDGNRLTPRGRNPQINLAWLGTGPRAVALNENGELILLTLRPDGFEEHGRTKIIGETWAHPGFSEGHILARDDERIVAYRLPVN